LPWDGTLDGGREGRCIRGRDKQGHLDDMMKHRSERQHFGCEDLDKATFRSAILQFAGMDIACKSQRCNQDRV